MRLTARQLNRAELDKELALSPARGAREQD